MSSRLLVFTVFFFFFCNSEDKSEDKFFLYAKQIIDTDSVFTQH